MRTSGTQVGKTDFTYISPDNVKLRSRSDVEKFLAGDLSKFVKEIKLTT